MVYIYCFSPPLKSRGVMVNRDDETPVMTENYQDDLAHISFVKLVAYTNTSRCRELVGTIPTHTHKREHYKDFRRVLSS